MADDFLLSHVVNISRHNQGLVGCCAHGWKPGRLDNMVLGIGFGGQCYQSKTVWGHWLGQLVHGIGVLLVNQYNPLGMGSPLKLG